MMRSPRVDTGQPSEQQRDSYTRKVERKRRKEWLARRARRMQRQRRK